MFNIGLPRLDHSDFLGLERLLETLQHCRGKVEGVKASGYEASLGKRVVDSQGCGAGTAASIENADAGPKKRRTSEE
jgi:hypothetical protein